MSDHFVSIPNVYISACQVIDLRNKDVYAQVVVAVKFALRNGCHDSLVKVDIDVFDIEIS